MNIEIFWSDSCPQPSEPVKGFLKRMANRLMVGAYRYGSPHSRKKYMSRLTEELKAYKRTGNEEHLLNIANYAWLESQAPENKKFHFDPNAPSATRSKFGGNIA